VEIKKGHPSGEPRTSDEQTVVRARALDKVLRSTSSGQNVVLEFLIYERPPGQLIFYQAELTSRGVDVIVKALRPGLDVILARQRARGRPHDADVKSARLNAEHQIACLQSEHLHDAWIVDNSDDTLDATYARHFRPIVES
jgi:hypothetical protein